MIEGLKLALKHSTKYEDRMYLSFLIKVEQRRLDKFYKVTEMPFVPFDSYLKAVPEDYFLRQRPRICQQSDFCV